MKYWKILWPLVPTLLFTVYFLSRVRSREMRSPTENTAIGGIVSFAKFTVIVDNNPGGPGLLTRWGVSILVEADNHTILFDTGPDPEALKLNMQALGVNVENIDTIFISHGHHDHVGGISYIAEAKRGAMVYLPSHAGKSLKEGLKRLGLKVVEVSEPTEIYPGIISLGEMYGPPYEHSLAVCLREGVVVVVGCSHPGVEKIVKKAYEATGKPVIMVIGGMHLGGASEERLKSIVDTFRSVGVKAVFPIHCSGDNARRYFEAALGEAYMDGHVGVKVAVQSGKIEIIGGN